MTNLITTNASTFEWCGYQLVGLLSSPFQIAICTFLLYKYIGAATFVGLSTMIVFIPLNTFFAILSGIRVIKFYGWVSKNIIFLIELNIIN